MDTLLTMREPLTAEAADQPSILCEGEKDNASGTSGHGPSTALMCVVLLALLHVLVSDHGTDTRDEDSSLGKQGANELITTPAVLVAACRDAHVGAQAEHESEQKRPLQT